MTGGVGSGAGHAARPHRHLDVGVKQHKETQEEAWRQSEHVGEHVQRFLPVVTPVERSALVQCAPGRLG
jgi:hypothetical protein